jgi:K+-transporting ATPase ATPase C chain
MTSLFAASVRFAVVSFLGAGLLWPLCTTLALELAMPGPARGSLIERDGRIVASELVGQAFTSERYLHGRPSAAGYDPRAAAGSNLAPSNPALRERVATDASALAASAGVGPSEVPPDAVAASGSGLDPHVSPAHAALQIERIARARGLDAEVVRAVVDGRVETGVFGPARVNVVAVNLALDALSSSGAGDRP